MAANSGLSNAFSLVDFVKRDSDTPSMKPPAGGGDPVAVENRRLHRLDFSMWKRIEFG